MQKHQCHNELKPKKQKKNIQKKISEKEAVAT